MRQPLSAPDFRDLSGSPAGIRTDASALGAEPVNPVGRTVAELELLLTPLLQGEASDDKEKRSWPVGQTIGFIVFSCGLFWATAAYVAWSLL